MEQPAALPPSPSSSSFAGLLASLTSPAPAVAGNNGEVADDVVTLTYEQALRNHAPHRFHRFGPHSDSPKRPAGDAAFGNWDNAPSAMAARTDEAAATPVRDSAGSSAASRDLRTASVTIRLSEAECALLRERAAEAELTVSAYLRSCVLEADALRAQVKEALAKMKVAVGTQTVAAPVRTPFFGWIRRIWKRK